MPADRPRGRRRGGRAGGRAGRRPGRGRAGGAAGGRGGRRRCASGGIPCFGPDAAAAQLEGSKAFAKEVMAAAGVPTAHGRTSARRPTRSRPRCDAFGAPYVVKDDGLAAGKGVVVTYDRDAALAHARACLARDGGTVVVEEFLDGPEVSLFCVTDGHEVVAARARPGLQAARRRRRRAEHRWHGRVLAAAVGARRSGRRGRRAGRPARRRRDGAPRDAVQRAALRRPRPHLARACG